MSPVGMGHRLLISSQMAAWCARRWWAPARSGSRSKGLTEVVLRTLPLPIVKQHPAENMMGLRRIRVLSQQVNQNLPTLLDPSLRLPDHCEPHGRRRIPRPKRQGFAEEAFGTHQILLRRLTLEQIPARACRLMDTPLGVRRKRSRLAAAWPWTAGEPPADSPEPTSKTKIQPLTAASNAAAAAHDDQAVQRNPAADRLSARWVCGVDTTGATNRYPRRGNVSMKRGDAAPSPSAFRS